jgi:hypothetical protein
MVPKTTARVVEQVVGKDVVGTLGVREVSVLALLGERVGVKPLEELEVHAHATEAVLRGVDVDVVHARDDKLARVVNNANALVLGRKLLVDALDNTINNYQVAILGPGERVVVARPDDVALDCKCVLVHDVLPSRKAHSACAVD